MSRTTCIIGCEQHTASADPPALSPRRRLTAHRRAAFTIGSTLLIATAMVGCTPEPPEQTPSSPASRTTESLPLLKDHLGEQELAPDRYVIDTVDPPSAPLVPVLSVPEGYGGIGAGVGADEGPNFLLVWDIQSVYSHPCDAVAEPVGPSVAALANALAAQPLRNGTDPVPVKVGGYDGLYVELSTPEGIDLDKCLLRAFNSWPGRSQTELGTLDLLWIVDVEGQRFTFDVSHARTAGPEQVDELKAMVTTATFVPRQDP